MWWPGQACGSSSAAGRRRSAKIPIPTPTGSRDHRRLVLSPKIVAAKAADASRDRRNARVRHGFLRPVGHAACFTPAPFRARSDAASRSVGGCNGFDAFAAAPIRGSPTDPALFQKVTRHCPPHSGGIMSSIAAAVAKLADALGSGPSGSKIPWRFKSSQPHSPSDDPMAPLSQTRGRRADGLWTSGQRTARLTRSRTSDAPLSLRIRCGTSPRNR